MKKCERFLIIANELKDTDLKWSKYTDELIKGRGYTSMLHVGLDQNGLGEILDNTDVVIVMGGDGTMLRVSHTLNGRDIPVIGVNLGTVGFMTEVVVSEIDSMIDRLIAGDYEIENRMMLKGTVTHEVSGHETEWEKEEVAYALNDIVFARENALRLIAVRIYVNDNYFDTCEADGILIATPTGSTGYNLSAGGPIVKGDARLMVMTPISPYSLSRRSVIFGEEDKITLEIIRKRKDIECNGLVSFDGASTFKMELGSKVDIEVSPYTFSKVKLNDSSVYEILRKKLGV